MAKKKAKTVTVGPFEYWVDGDDARVLKVRCGGITSWLYMPNMRVIKGLEGGMEGVLHLEGIGECYEVTGTGFKDMAVVVIEKKKVVLAKEAKKRVGEKK